MGFILIAVTNIALINFAFMKAVADTSAHILTAETIKQIAPILPSTPQTKLSDYAVN